MTFKLKIIGLAVLVLWVAVNCGKKGPLVLEPELLPQQVTNLKSTQVGQLIKLQWDFPAQLSGNSKDKDALKMNLEGIRQIKIYYSNKEIPGGKFQKKASVLRKLVFSELTEVTTTTAATAKPTVPSSVVVIAPARKSLSFSVTLPFQLKHLENKPHFFAVEYEFRRNKSPLSEIAFIQTVIPVKAVEGLAVSRENKMIKLTWKRPDKDVAEKITTAIAGYNVFKKIEPDEAEKANELNESSGAKKESPDKKQKKEAALKITPKTIGVFEKINQDKVLMEYYEDTDTGTNGKYFYYVSAIVANNIESAPSTEVSLQVTDTFPPEIPANLVCFKAADHMFLTWQAVSDKDFSFYRVYRSLTPEDDFVLIADNVPSNQFKDKTVTKGKTYYYMISAVDQKGNESQYSSMAKEQF